AQLSREKEALLQAVSVDHRTGLANTAAFDADHAQLHSRFERSGDPYCLLLIDVDNFHAFNHRYHYLAGNRVLKRIAAALADTIRSSDRVYRWGGEEFAVLLSGTRLDAAAVAAERARAAIEQLGIEHAGNPPGVVTVTVGVAEPAVGESGADLFEHVSALLVEGKDRGRNRIVLPPAGTPGDGAG
ncbi:MAG TPA: GGDEF domain-containing protein, partial [Acidimicrobiales bacterium]|nr:GGDEF domain-containing protein [Acidimicrobiales bacterium]